MKLISFLFLFAYTQISFAHDPGLSSAEVVLDKKSVDISITFALQDTESFAPMDKDGDAEVSAEERETSKSEVAALIAKELEVTLNNENVKPFTIENVTFDAQNNAHILFHYQPAATSLKMRLLFLNKLPDGHKQVVTIKDATGNNLSEKMLTQQDNVIELNLAAGESSSMFKDFFVLGIEHILTGYDHLLFLFALLIVTHRFWSAFGIITFFTIAHSITLAIAGMNLLTIPSPIVEPLIAASIVYVGVENLIVKEPKGRKYLTFAFGLIHGFGFADNAADAGKDATWYGVNTHLTYDIKDNLTAGIRGEWFRDQDGVRVFAPARTAGALVGSSYYAVTAGVNWKPMNLKWLNLRPNVRYDWADGSRPFGNTKQDQFLFSTDFSVNF